MPSQVVIHEHHQNSYTNKCDPWAMEATRFGRAVGGGWGFSSTKFGIVSDNILGALAIANGTLVTATANQNSNLFFALCGASANSFDIVTQFTFRVHDVSFPITHFKYTWIMKNQQFQSFKAFQTWGVEISDYILASLYMDP